ncbi:porin PorA family protein [Streptomyces flavalbus]|uniref:Porin PorA family protein n=1 Tax=Streptomyces flavalbus TaxID=2665155 RepID=A0ABW2WGY9_9ACTN
MVRQPGVRLVVDQPTGRVLYAGLGPRQTLRAPGAKKDAVVVLDARKLAHTSETQEFAVGHAREDGARLRAVGTTVPVGAATAGVVLATAGTVLLLRGRRTGE